MGALHPKGGHVQDRVLAQFCSRFPAPPGMDTPARPVLLLSPQLVIAQGVDAAPPAGPSQLKGQQLKGSAPQNVQAPQGKDGRLFGKSILWADLRVLGEHTASSQGLRKTFGLQKERRERRNQTNKQNKDTCTQMIPASFRDINIL